jgi:L-ascorbate metabolism protein UlaG (beta-lactamase superfamily)
MKITKIGHCCLLVEVAGKRILTDPGKFTTSQNDLRDLDIILITHEHGDHLHTDSLVEILTHNPTAVVVTNSSVGKILDALGITHRVQEGKTGAEVADISLIACDGQHEEIYADDGIVQNTGYLIADTLFYPGDSYSNPGRAVEVLALPVAGPWCKSADAIAYAKALKPKSAFPVHDGLLNKAGMATIHTIFGRNLAPLGVTFIPLTEGETHHFA